MDQCGSVGPALSLSLSLPCQEASAVSISGRRCCTSKIPGVKSKRGLVIAWRWKFRKGRAECQSGSSWETKRAEMAQGDPEESGRQWEIKKCGFLKQILNLFLVASFSARHFQSVRAIKSRWQTSPGWAEIWEVVKNFCTAFHSIWTLAYENLSLCLHSHRDVQAGANLSFNRQFYDEHWSKHRVVTCMDWSLQVRCEAGGCVSISLPLLPIKLMGRLCLLFFTQSRMLFLR